jgi:hypothetical protein
MMSQIAAWLPFGTDRDDSATGRAAMPACCKTQFQLLRRSQPANADNYRAMFMPIYP